MSVAPSARAAALQILLAHFPNVPFLMRDIARSYEPDVVRDLPTAMAELRERLEGELRQAQVLDAAVNVSTTKV